jgi:hypothetical protein
MVPRELNIVITFVKVTSADGHQQNSVVITVAKV